MTRGLFSDKRLLKGVNKPMALKLTQNAEIFEPGDLRTNAGLRGLPPISESRKLATAGLSAKHAGERIMNLGAEAKTLVMHALTG